MILSTSQPATKRELWDHLAREFDYSCPSCQRRPVLEDCEAFLVTGFCRACGRQSQRASSEGVSAVAPS